MFSQEQLQELLALDIQGERILSVYLDADSAAESIETIKLRLRGMLKEAQLGRKKGVEAIERYLDHSYDWSKPGLALFSSSDGAFFRAYPAAVSFRNRFRVGMKPYVIPLAHLLDHYAHYGVILVDKIGARFFEYHLGELQVQDGFMGEDVRKLKKGGGSSAVGMRSGGSGARREEEIAHRNLRDAATSAGQFFNGKPVRRLFLGGTAETVAQFREMLSKKLQSSVAGTFSVDMNAGEHEVGALSLALLKEANQGRELKIVDKLIATHAQGGSAVIALDDALQAVSDKRVQTLVISDGFRVPGYIHPESGFVVSSLARSPLSERELTAVDDVIDAAVTQTIVQGGQVEVVADNPKLEEIGHIGAILRY
jgi:peptide subunit release factor 1 (eRF1)